MHLDNSIHLFKHAFVFLELNGPLAQVPGRSNHTLVIRGLKSEARLRMQLGVHLNNTSKVRKPRMTPLAFSMHPTCFLMLELDLAFEENRHFSRSRLSKCKTESRQGLACRPRSAIPKRCQAVEGLVLKPCHHGCGGIVSVEGSE